MMRKQNLIARIDSELRNSQWDAFLHETPGGHHLQTSAWAAIKQLAHYRPVRILVQDRDQLVAGGQLLIKSLPLIGTVAYLPKGPVCARRDRALLSCFMTRLDSLMAQLKVRYCIIQPPENSCSDCFPASDFNYSSSSIKVAPTSSVRISLDQTEQEILSRMKSKTRYNIRHGLRQGIVVRKGNRSDLNLFHSLLKLTGKRHQFEPAPEDYYLHWWDIFQPHAHLFLAESNQEVLSAAYVITFGDTVYYKRGAWSGRQGHRHPNEVMHWQIIRWAGKAGYAYYDLEGIDRHYAESLLHNQLPPVDMVDSVSRFKTGFGGQVVLYPIAFERFYSRPLQLLHQLAGHRTAPRALLNFFRKVH